MSDLIDDMGRRAALAMHDDLRDLDVDAALTLVLAAAAVGDEPAPLIALDRQRGAIARRRWHAAAGVAAAILLVGAGIATLSRRSDNTHLAGPAPSPLAPGSLESSTPPRALVEVAAGPIVISGVSFASVPQGFEHYNPATVEVASIGPRTRLTLEADDGRSIEVYVETGAGASDAIGNKVGSATKEGDDNVVRWEEPGGTAVELRSSSVSLAELHTMAIMARGA